MMKSDYIETKCGNCRYWYPWRAFAVKGELSERRAVQKGGETGCDGKCCCYESREVTPSPIDSSNTYVALHCDYYSPVRRSK